MVIEAKRSDGTPAQKGDSVFCVWGNHHKCVGRITKVAGPRTFSILSNTTLQTYFIACPDGTTRQAHAGHITEIFKPWGFR